MRHTITSLLAAVAFAGSLLAAQNCLAETDQLQSDTYMDLFAEFGQAASENELVLESGGQATEIDKIYMQLNDVGMSAKVDGNVLDSEATGMNLIGYDAFSNMNGFATVIQNSGNQVIVESSTIVNVYMQN